MSFKLCKITYNGFRFNGIAHRRLHVAYAHRGGKRGELVVLQILTAFIHILHSISIIRSGISAEKTRPKFLLVTQKHL